MYTGSCLCGGIQFELSGELQPIQVCHCVQCRKAQGTAIATNIPVNEDSFRLLEGEPLLTAYESSPGKQRVFCNRCGSPIYSKTVKKPGVLRIRAGILDGELNTRPQYHFYTGSKANWYEIGDNLPQFTAGYTPKT